MTWREHAVGSRIPQSAIAEDFPFLTISSRSPPHASKLVHRPFAVEYIRGEFACHEPKTMNDIQKADSELLAIDGGTPEVPGGPPQWPVHDEDVTAAVHAAMTDGSWGRYDGRHGLRLTKMLCEMHQVEHALCCASGTIAVELALRGLRIQPGDEVIVAGYDFSGNFRAVEAVGARPVLIDIQPQTWCIDVEEFEQAIGPQTRCIIVSHLHGGTAPMPELCEIARRHGMTVVEDACQSPGAVVAGRIAGTWGDVGVLSFGGSKLLTAGRGGAVITNQADIYQRTKIYCERGNHICPLSELQAAVLVPQIEKLDDRNQQRLTSVQHLLRLTAAAPNLTPLSADFANDRPCFYKVPWLYGAIQEVPLRREALIAAMQAEGLAIDAGFRGFTRRSQRRCRVAGNLTNAQKAAEATILLHHPVLLSPPATIAAVARAINKVAAAMQPTG